MAVMNNFSLLFFLASGMFMVAAMADYTEKETNMTVYFHDYSSGGPNSTARILVGFPGKLWAYDQFGTIYVFDDLITEGPEVTSSVVGRGQGISVTASLDGVYGLSPFAIVFTNQAYNGSTIQLQGDVVQVQTITEYGVVSGTGKFRYAKGYVTFEIISYDPITSYTLFRLNLTIRH